MREMLSYKSAWEMDAYPRVGTVQVFCDGGLAGPANPALEGGTWAYLIRVRRPQGWEFVGSGSGLIEPQSYGLSAISNNVSEMQAMMEGAKAAIVAFPAGPYQVFSDSYVTLQRVFRGARMNGLPSELRAKAMVLADAWEFDYRLLDGHPTRKELENGVGKRGNPVHLGNVWCDHACQGLREGRETWAKAVCDGIFKQMFP